MSTQDTVVRAFQLAREGRCRSIDDIRRTLKAEKHEAVDGHLSGTLLKKQLLEAIRAGAA